MLEKPLKISQIQRKTQQNLGKIKGIGRDHAATSPGFEPGTILDRAYFPARVERVPQDVNQLGWQNLGQFLAKFCRNLVTPTSLRRGRGGKSKAKSKAKDKA